MVNKIGKIGYENAMLCYLNKNINGLCLTQFETKNKPIVTKDVNPVIGVKEDVLDVKLCEVVKYPDYYADIIFNKCYEELIDYDKFTLPETFITNYKNKLDEKKFLITNSHDIFVEYVKNIDSVYYMKSFIEKYYPNITYEKKLISDCYTTVEDKEYYVDSSNNNQFIYSYSILDFCLNVFEDIQKKYDLDNNTLCSWFTDENICCELFKVGKLNGLIKIEYYINDLKEIMREMKTLMKYSNNVYDNYYIFTFDTRFDNIFVNQGIRVIHPKNISDNELYEEFIMKK